MTHRRVFSILCGVLLLSVPSTRAQEPVGRMGLGGYASLYYPTMGLQEHHRSSSRYGAYFQYAASPRLNLEVEYHRAVFEPGLIAERPMRWPVDLQLYDSPRSENTLTFNGASVNGLYYFQDRTADGARGAPYLHFGGGFYHYDSEVSGLIWPGQTSQPLDPNLLIPPFEDKGFGLSFSLGLGIETMVTRSAALDVRGRYTMVVGELRSMEAYGLSNVWPLQMIDVGIGMKYYIWKSR